MTKLKKEIKEYRNKLNIKHYLWHMTRIWLTHEHFVRINKKWSDM